MIVKTALQYGLALTSKQTAEDTFSFYWQFKNLEASYCYNSKNNSV